MGRTMNPASICLLAALAAGSARPADPLPPVAPYARDSDHAWNRAYRALYVRRTPAGREVGRDELDPLIWPESSHLFDPLRCAQALGALDEILSGALATTIEDPLRRALFQRDLWAVFDALVLIGSSDDAGARLELVRRAQLADRATPTVVTADEVETVATARHRTLRALEERLARTMQHVALDPAAIAKLPDNFALAIAANAQLPNRIALAVAANEKLLLLDPVAIGCAPLPADLFAANGPWVLVSADDAEPREPFARAHALASSGRSSFAIYVRTPGGRAATRAWLRALCEFDPVLVEACPGSCMTRSVAWDLSGAGAASTTGSEESSHRHYNPELPRPPLGTSFALVRRMLLFDRGGRLHATSIVESVQLRTIVRDGGPGPDAGYDGASWKPFQSVAEHELQRGALFSGVRGGLVPIGPDEQRYSTLASHGFDPVDVAPIREGVRLDTCFGCHGQPGMLAVNSYTRSASGPGTLPSMPLRSPPARLIEESLAGVQSTALRYKSERYDWGYLRGILRGDVQEGVDER